MSEHSEDRPGLHVGFLGLGKMGTAMAQNLLDAGYTMTVYNRSPAATEPFVVGGATAAATPLDLARAGPPLIFSMLENEVAVQSVFVDTGMLPILAASVAAAPADTKQHWSYPTPIHVCCSTLPVAYVRRLTALHAEQGVTLVMMPVLGRPDAAAAGKLHLLMAGPQSARDVLDPLLVPVFGQTLRYYGEDTAKSAVMKIAFNFALASCIETISEGSALVQGYGMEPHDFTELLSRTLFQCTAYTGYGDLIAQRKFIPAGATVTGVGVKDNRLALEAGQGAGVPLPLASIVRDHFMEAQSVGMGEWDWSALAIVAERHAGIVKPDHPQPAPRERKEDA